MVVDSDKTYGPDDTDFVRHQRYGNWGTVVSVKKRLFYEACRKTYELMRELRSCAAFRIRIPG
jgi:hypothetical protein